MKSGISAGTFFRKAQKLSSPSISGKPIKPEVRCWKLNIYSVILIIILQFLEINPFSFFPNREMPWLDVCTSLEQWLLLSRIKDGLLFKAFSGGYDRIDLNKNKKMVRK